MKRIKTFSIRETIAPSDKLAKFKDFYCKRIDGLIVAVSFYIVSVWDIEDEVLIDTFERNTLDEFENIYGYNVELTNTFDVPDCVRLFHKRIDTICHMLPVMYDHELVNTTCCVQPLQQIADYLSDRDYESAITNFRVEMKL